jgi:hypothetical protein
MSELDEYRVNSVFEQRQGYIMMHLDFIIWGNYLREGIYCDVPINYLGVVIDDIVIIYCHKLLQNNLGLSTLTKPHRQVNMWWTFNMLKWIPTIQATISQETFVRLKLYTMDDQTLEYAALRPFD